MKRNAILLILLLLLLLVSSVQAMNSANFAIDWMIPLTSGGGGAAASSNYAIQYSVGQVVVGESDSTNYASNMGFWQNFITYIRTWVPVVYK
jgi:hypothetical protein